MPEILRYAGDQTNYDPDLVLGPDRDGRRMKIVGAAYDEAADITTVTLRAVMPAEFRERLEAQQPKIIAYNTIRGLFRG